MAGPAGVRSAPSTICCGRWRSERLDGGTNPARVSGGVAAGSADPAPDDVATADRVGVPFDIRSGIGHQRPAERGGEVRLSETNHTLRVPESANREERALDVALAAIDRVLTLADQMDKAPDAHTRALAASIRNAVTGAAPMAEQMTFIISRKGDRWWGRTFGAPDWSVFSNNRAEVERACREFVAERTGRPSSETTILFVDEPPSSPQRDALCAIDDRLSSLEYEVGGLRVVVNEALLQFARAGESADQQAIERVRALHRVCTETPLDEGGCDEPICVHDGQAWPCHTIRALEEGKQ